MKIKEIFGKKAGQDPYKPILALDRELLALALEEKEVRARKYELEDEGGGPGLDELTARLKEIPELIKDRQLKMESLIEKMVEAEITKRVEAKASYPETMKQYWAEQAAGLERGMRQLAEGMLLIETYEPKIEDRVVQLQFKQAPFGLELDEKVQRKIGHYRGVFNARQNELREQEAVALTFPERLQYLQNLKNWDTGHLKIKARAGILNELGRRRKEAGL